MPIRTPAQHYVGPNPPGTITPDWKPPHKLSAQIERHTKQDDKKLSFHEWFDMFKADYNLSDPYVVAISAWAASRQNT